MKFPHNVLRAHVPVIDTGGGESLPGVGIVRADQLTNVEAEWKNKSFLLTKAMINYCKCKNFAFFIENEIILFRIVD